MSVPSPALAQVLRFFPRHRFKGEGSGWRGPCPTHEGDAGDNLAIFEGDDGRIILKCHSRGCDFKDIAAAAGCPTELLNPERPKPAQRRELSRRDYECRDFDGTLLARHHRIDYDQDDAKGDRKRVWWDDGTRYAKFPPFGAEKVTSWDTTKPVIIVEGEKACESLWQRGYQALGLYGRGHKLTDAVLQRVAGFPLVLWADADPPQRNRKTGAVSYPGPEAMDGIAGRLTALGHKPRCIVWPDAPRKGDAADFKGSLEELLSADEPWSPGFFIEHNPHREPSEAQVAAPAPSGDDGDGLTDLDNAERLVARHGENIRYVPAFARWLLWTGIHWDEDRTLGIERLAHETARSIFEEHKAVTTEAVTAAKAGRDEQAKALKAKADALWQWAKRSKGKERLRAMVDLAKGLPRIAVDVGELDTDPWLFNCRNGTIDLKTGQLRPHAREDLITMLAPVDFRPADVAHQVFDDFLLSAVPDLEMQAFLQRAVGSSLVGIANNDRVLLLLGPGGTGKSTLLEAVKAMLGEYGAQSSMETFTMAKQGRGASDDDLARLRGRRAVFIPEAGRAGGSMEVLKAASGGDTLTARHPYGKTFEFTPTFTLWLRANSRPRMPDDDGGLRRRIVELPFQEQFKNPDETIRETLKNDPAARVAVLAWAVQGCRYWQEMGLRELPPVVDAATKEFWDEMNPLAPFIEERCVEGDTYEGAARPMYQDYVRWERSQGTPDHRIMSETKFGRRMSAKYTKVPRETGKFYKGIGLKEATHTRTESL